MKTLYLMRHGETVFNVRRKIQGWCDSPLTENGINQAKKAKEYFEKNMIEFDKAYCSTSERCSDTLEIITSMPYTRLKGLKEKNFGIFEGESEDLHPPREKFDTHYEQFGGETTIKVMERMKKTIQEIMDQDEHSSVLMVSHGGAGSCFLRNFHDLQELGITKLPNCCICKYTYDNGNFTFIELIDPCR